MAKILQINAVYNRGSTGIIVKDISQMSINAGWESYVAAANFNALETNGTHFIRIGQTFDHKLHAALSRILGLHGYFSRNATRKLLKEIDTIQPDIIHIHNLHSNFINVNMLFRHIKENKIKTVITLHDCWFFTGKCYHFLYDHCEKWKNHCQCCPRLHAEIPSMFFDFSSRVFDDRKKYIGDNENVHVIGVSQWITNEARKSLLSNRVDGTIYNGVDLKVFHPKQSSKREELGLIGKFVILGMANKWLAEENKETYQAYRKFKKENWVLVLLGCKNKAFIEPDVIGLPYVKNRDTLAEIYSISDVFANITKVDSFPTVSIEALACGTPVVTYISGGSAEIIDENVGYAVSYGDIEALISSIEKIETKGKNAYSENCVKRTQRNYDSASCYRKYLELYQRLMEYSEEQ